LQLHSLLILQRLLIDRGLLILRCKQPLLEMKIRNLSKKQTNLGR
jgi:hypothetical protein